MVLHSLGGIHRCFGSDNGEDAADNSSKMVAMIMVIMAMVIVKMVTVRLVFMLVKEHGDSVVRLTVVKMDAMIVAMVKRLSLTSTTAIILNIKLLS